MAIRCAINGDGAPAYPKNRAKRNTAAHLLVGLKPFSSHPRSCRRGLFVWVDGAHERSWEEAVTEMKIVVVDV